MTKQIRWDCPNGEHPGVLGPRKPRRDNLCRYCLRCSEKAGRLVERTSPTLETRRQASRQRSAEKAAKRRQKKIASRTQADFVTRFSGVTSALGESMLLFGGRMKPIVEVRPANKPRHFKIVDDGTSIGPRLVIYDHGGDKYDARAAVVIAELTYYGKHLHYARPVGDVNALKRYIRTSVRETIGLRFPLHSLKDATAELAQLLRAQAALKHLGDPSLLGRSVGESKIPMTEIMGVHPVTNRRSRRAVPRHHAA